MSQYPNLKVFSGSEQFLDTLRNCGIIQEGHFEYKGKAEDGTRKHGEYYINFRLLTTEQEHLLAPFYHQAIDEFYGDIDNLIIVGVAMGSLFLPKVVQTGLYDEKKIEFVYTEKRERILGLYGEQAAKCKGKHILFIEDICNNATSSYELINEMKNKQEGLGITGFSMLYGVHRGHTFLEEPVGDLYAMGVVKAPAYHKSECPACEKVLPLKEYKK